MRVSAPDRKYRLWLPVVLLAGISVFPRVASAADPAAAARVATADGQVSVLRNGEMWALFAGHDVRVGEMIVTGPGGVARLEISDGSSFIVYPNSQVVFRSNPGSMRELVDVLLGRIKLYIQSIGGRPDLPYRVHSPTAVISVRGTVFEVAVDADNVTSIAVDEGLVLVEHRLLPGKAVALGPGQSMSVYPNAALAAAGVNKTRVAARVAEFARDTLLILGRVPGRRPSGPGGAAPPPAPLPGDRDAPPPPPPPPPPPGS